MLQIYFFSALSQRVSAVNVLWITVAPLRASENGYLNRC
jgi:hypothetical protein